MFLTGEHGHRTCATPVRLRRQRCLQLRRCRRAPVLGLQRSLFVRLEATDRVCFCVLGVPVSCAGRGVSFGPGSPRGQRSMSTRNAANLRQANMSCIRAAALLRSCCSFSAASCQCREETQSAWTRPALLPLSASFFMVLRSALFFLFSCSFLVLLACQQNFKTEVRVAWARLQGLCRLGLFCCIFFGSCLCGAPCGRQALLLVLCCFFILGGRAWRRTTRFFCACGGWRASWAAMRHAPTMAARNGSRAAGTQLRLWASRAVCFKLCLNPR